MFVKDPQKQKHILELNNGAAFKYPKINLKFFEELY